MQTINEELHQRTDELSHVNGFLESILSSLRGGVVVLDRDLVVLLWNRRSEELWGLRTDEVRGKHFLNLDCGLPVEALHQPIRLALSETGGPQELQLNAVNRRGKAIHCKVTCLPLGKLQDHQPGVIVIVEETEESGATAT